MSPDPKWLELLKASGWQTFAIATGCAVLFALIQRHILPSPGDALLVAIAGVGIVCACLSAASILNAVVRAVPVGRWFSNWNRRRRSRKSVADYIPFMTDDDRAIIGYLLHYQQKTFTAAHDGGAAVGLISRGIVVVAARPGQTFSVLDVPMAIPDLVWDVLVEHRDEFPIPDPDDAHPWRNHWMA